MPPFAFFLYSFKEPILESSTIWIKPLPVRKNQLQNHPKQDFANRISHRDYYSAARSFLEKNNFEIITRAATSLCRRTVAPDEIKEIRICLVKHGEFYHPAKIEIVTQQATLSFVLNVAISDTGKTCLHTEYPLLVRLSNEFYFNFLPMVYGKGDVYINESGPSLSMFLGQWFEGFNEFHISIDPVDKKTKIQVWDCDQGNFFLTQKQMKKVYEQAAMILTCYYNIRTFEHIFSWHQAAGDFILKKEKDTISLKLITVRNYQPMFNHQESDELVLWQALLIFFLNLSIRMRLDRMDGIGKIVWSDDMAVAGTLNGFLKGLELKSKSLPHSNLLGVHFKTYLKELTEPDLLDLLHGIVGRYNPLSPDVTVIKQHLKAHGKCLYRRIREA